MAVQDSAPDPAAPCLEAMAALLLPVLHLLQGQLKGISEDVESACGELIALLDEVEQHLAADPSVTAAPQRQLVEAIAKLQISDSLRQRVEGVADALGQMQCYLHSSRRQGHSNLASEEAQALSLGAIEARYCMARQRQIHASRFAEESAEGDEAPPLEFF